MTLESLLETLAGTGWRLNGLGQRDETADDRWWCSLYRRRSSKTSDLTFITEFGDDAFSALQSAVRRAEAPVEQPDRKPAKRPAIGDLL